jgi:hypothetical protein
MPNWIRKDGGEGEGGADDKSRQIEIKPEQVREALKDDLAKIDSMSTTLSTVAEYIQAQKDKEQKAIETEEARRRAEENKTDEIDWLNDPEGATRKTMRPLVEGQAAMAAILMRKETLGDMEYYNSDPEFKAAVDSLIDQQPLVARANASTIMHAYKSVYYDKRKEIADGKIKSAMSINSNNGGGSGKSGKDDEGDGGSVTMSNEEKMYARKMGIKEEDWMKSKKELEYV